MLSLGDVYGLSKISNCVYLITKETKLLFHLRYTYYESLSIVTDKHVVNENGVSFTKAFKMCFISIRISI